MARAKPPGHTTRSGLGWAWQRARLQVFALYGQTCYLCGHPADSVDHLDPRKTHGPAVPPIDRLRPVCRSCNSRKGARPLSALTQQRTSRRW
jgi:5-methylcytosine-specific restriction endonuclease McrA